MFQTALTWNDEGYQKNSTQNQNLMGEEMASFFEYFLIFSSGVFRKSTVRVALLPRRR